MRRAGIVLCGAVLLLFGGAFGPAAFADSFSTSGCFSVGTCSIGTTTLATATIYDVSNPLQADSTVTFGGVGATLLQAGDLDLGTITFNQLQSGIGVLVTGFSLDVVDPSAGGGTGFNALMTGDVYGDAGGVTITFNPITETFTDSTGATWDLTLDANPIQVSSADPSVQIDATFVDTPGTTGNDNSANLAEPSTLLLSVFGIAGLFLLRRRFDAMLPQN